MVNEHSRTCVPVNMVKYTEGWGNIRLQGNVCFTSYYPCTPGTPLSPQKKTPAFTRDCWMESDWKNTVSIFFMSHIRGCISWLLVHIQVIRGIQPGTPKPVLLMHLLMWFPPRMVACGSIYFQFHSLTYSHTVLQVPSESKKTSRELINGTRVLHLVTGQGPVLFFLPFDVAAISTMYQS